MDTAEIAFTLVDDKISLLKTTAVDELPLFAAGGVSVQDIHAQKLIDLIIFKEGDYVLDACSAPGGKLCQILENYNVEALALDIDQNRLNRVQQNLDRLKLTAKLILADASHANWWDGRKFDVIVADVPCSASGTLKRNPDIKIHRTPRDINNFVAQQRQIIKNLWQMLKPNGVMVYISCSIFKEENQDNIEYFKDTLPQIQISQELSLLPTQYADGFFYCVMKKFND